MKTTFISVGFGILTKLQSHTRNPTAWLSWVSASLLTWNVAGPSEVGSLAGSVVASEAAQSRNSRCLFPAEEGSELQTAVNVADSVAAEVEGGMVEGVGDSVAVVVAEASVAVATTMGVADAAVDMAAADSGV